MCVHGRIFPTGEVGGAQAKTEAGLLGRWAGLGSKQRRSYTGFGRGWRESRGGATGEVEENRGKAYAELLGRWAELQ